MWVDDETVRQFNAVECLPNARRSETCATIGAIDVHPHVLSMTNFANTLHIIYDTKICGASRTGHGKQTFTVYV